MHRRRSTVRGVPSNRVVAVGAVAWDRATAVLGSDQGARANFPANVVVTSKYTWWNFLPKNLFWQFKRVANAFFLFNAIVQLSVDSPVSPLPSCGSLVFVITVTAIKQAWEDYRRHVADDKVNNAPAVVIRQGQEQRVKASDIVVGDIVKVIEDETIPCDMVLLSSSSEDGTCHVTTANLDGETNLKRLESPSWDNTTALNLATPMGLNNMESFIECEKPQVDLYKFVGRITIMVNGIKKVCPLNAVNLLVSGSTLKETNHAYACAVYTGHQTKMAQNLSLKSNKFSTAERTMNKLILVVIGYLFLEILVCSIFHFTIDEYPEQREMNLEDARHPTDFLLFMTIFNYVVPVALYVSIEMQKLIGSQFFSSDQDMYDEENDTWPVCNTSDISEELGQINYLFSDKTGTLTENTMEFRQCSAAGKRWLLEKGKLQSVNGDDTGSSLPDEVERLLLNMVLNHTVQVAGSDKPIYKASSPDEKAFLEAAAEVGMIYKGVNPRKEAEIEYKKEILKFSVLQILDFDPTRKCMSVIVKDLKSGEIFVMCKGAESSLDSKIISGSKEKAFEHLENFAGEGLRTLVFGERKLTQEEYNEYNELITKAQNALIEREQNLSAVYSQIEKDLSCVGATGVEDMLQEGVRDTLVSLNKAGIHVWVLTGDKKSTAINISYSCGHFNLDMERHELSDITTALELGIKFEELNQKINSEKEHALVLDGKTLSLIWEHNMKEELSKLSEKCSTVLCCRMSPLHKAQIVAMVKQFKDQPICAAIGDGANDVSMIQEAHVGIGIMGKEGRQAVRCSDFAFSKFHYLKKAILVHGHWYYYRISIFVMYQVYKNLTFCSPQLYYAQQNLFSSATLFESLYMQAFNLVFTSLPIICYGVMEQNYPKQVLLDRPELYKNITKNALMTPKVFMKWIAMAFFHSLVYYFFPVGLLGNYVSLDLASYAVLSVWDLGVVVITTSVLVVNITLFIITKYWTKFTHLVYWGSIAVFVLFSVFYSVLWLSKEVHLSFLNTFSLPATWLCLFVSCVAALAPNVLYEVWTKHQESNQKRSRPDSQVDSVEMRDDVNTSLLA